MEISHGRLRTHTRTIRVEDLSLRFSAMTDHAITPRPLPSVPASLPRFWHPAGAMATYFFNALSLIFPPGERYFITSVRAFRKSVQDPKLTGEVKAFMAQESRHDRAHTSYNTQLDALGYDASGYEAKFEKQLEWARRARSPIHQLAQTVACEHFTAAVAEVALERGWFDELSPEVAEIWHWHAIEEAEHKAVCFDLYRAVGGAYWRRIVAYLEIALTFPILMLAMMVHMAVHDRRHLGLKDLHQGARFLLGRRGVTWAIAARVPEFLAPRFHPMQSRGHEWLRAQEQRLRSPRPAVGHAGADTPQHGESTQSVPR